MSSRNVIIVMGAERRGQKKEVTFKPITPPVPEEPKIEIKVDRSASESPKARDKKYSYSVQHYLDLKKTKESNKKFYEDAKSLMADLEISKTTFYKYLKLGGSCPKSYIIEKI